MQSNSGEIHKDFKESAVSSRAATEIDMENNYKNGCENNRFNFYKYS